MVQQDARTISGVLQGPGNLGETVRRQGPLDEKLPTFIQLAAAAAIRSRVRSTVTLAGDKGWSNTDEIYHTIMLLTSTIGFRRTSAA